MRLALIWAACAAAVGSAVCSGPAWAQAGPPPAWPALVRCAQLTDPAEELACYRAAMRAAGYKPDAQAAVAEKHRSFGLPKPSLNFLKHAPKEAQVAAAPSPAPAPAAAAPAQQIEQAQAQPAPAAAPAPAAPEDENLASFEIAQVALIPPANRLLIVTVDGAIWEQTDSLSVAPRPKTGGTLQIRRTRFGGYFCRFDRNNSVRCVRTH